MAPKYIVICSDIDMADVYDSLTDALVRIGELHEEYDADYEQIDLFVASPLVFDPPVNTPTLAKTVVNHAMLERHGLDPM